MNCCNLLVRLTLKAIAPMLDINPERGRRAVPVPSWVVSLGMVAVAEVEGASEDAYGVVVGLLAPAPSPVDQLTTHGPTAGRSFRAAAIVDVLICELPLAAHSDRPGCRSLRSRSYTWLPAIQRVVLHAPLMWSIQEDFQYLTDAGARSSEIAVRCTLLL
jgi:hypothetical protein